MAVSALRATTNHAAKLSWKHVAMTVESFRIRLTVTPPATKTQEDRFWFTFLHVCPKPVLADAFFLKLRKRQPQKRQCCCCFPHGRSASTRTEPVGSCRRYCTEKERLDRHRPDLQQTHAFRFWSNFRCVCPEPVLINDRVLYCLRK